MKQYAAIDIGGTKTRAVVFTQNREILYENECRGFGLSFDTDGGNPEYKSFLLDIPRRYAPCSVAVNLGGRNCTQIERITREAFPCVPVKVFRESEGDAPLSFAGIYDAKVALLAGTGTIAVVFHEGKKCILGGWGMNIGDDGSGYDIGLRAIRATLKALDSTEPLSHLERDICGMSEPLPMADDAKEICRRRDEVRTKINPFDRRSVASITKKVAYHAERGEADALAYLRDAGVAMGDLAVCAARKAGLGSGATVAVTGGLVNISDFWREAFEKRIKEEIPNARVYYDNDGVMKGTMELAVRISEEKI